VKPGNRSKKDQAKDQRQVSYLASGSVERMDSEGAGRMGGGCGFKRTFASTKRSHRPCAGGEWSWV